MTRHLNFLKFNFLITIAYIVIIIVVTMTSYDNLFDNSFKVWGRTGSSVTKCSPTMCKGLGSIPSGKKEKGRKERKKTGLLCGSYNDNYHFHPKIHRHPSTTYFSLLAMNWDSSGKQSSASLSNLPNWDHNWMLMLLCLSLCSELHLNPLLCLESSTMPSWLTFLEELAIPSSG